MEIEAVSEIVMMENLSDVEVEDIDDKPFEFLLKSIITDALLCSPFLSVLC